MNDNTFTFAVARGADVTIKTLGAKGRAIGHFVDRSGILQALVEYGDLNGNLKRDYFDEADLEVA